MSWRYARICTCNYCQRPKKGRIPSGNHSNIRPEVTEEFAQTVVLYLADAPQAGHPILRVSYFPQTHPKRRAQISRITLFIDYPSIGRTEVTVESNEQGLHINITSSNAPWVAHLLHTQEQLQSRLQHIESKTRAQIFIKHRVF
ncbi:MAG: hypothetical protein Q9P14_05915 [candidate division KSB1 bacterium]|nr:hypothetical protein [candidate division KSB1 bacterium]